MKTETIFIYFFLNNFIYKAINDPVGGALVTPVINTLKHVDDEGVYTTVNRNYYQNVGSRKRPKLYEIFGRKLKSRGKCLLHTCNSDY